MGDFLGSRDGIQCRSHHIKQLRTHKKLKNILSKYRKKHPADPRTLLLRKNLKITHNLEIQEKSTKLSTEAISPQNKVKEEPSPISTL